MSSTTYNGSCHCGKVKYTVEASIDKLLSCNCSICSRAGWLLAFVPAAQVKIEAGADNLTDYMFGKERVHHTFCKTCGVRTFSNTLGRDGQPMYAVNVRCLEDFDLESVPTVKVDGKNF